MKIKLWMAVLFGILAVSAKGWPAMPMPVLHVEGRWLIDDEGHRVNLHGFGQTFSPWFNEMGSKWNNYDVDACLRYNKDIIDGVMDRAGWKMNYVRMHMDPYWSNTPGKPTEGEGDISAFDFSRFKTYLERVFIPMAEYAVSKGLYVVMRPPGVCPHRIEVGGPYHEYLKKVWGYVATVGRLTSNPQIMFELANEPVDILATDGVYSGSSDGAHRALTQFFQEIVDLMRGSGCNNILWVPGTGYQSQYAGFAKYPVKGENIGYAVHVYPGWYGSDAIEPSHELGGSYGGGYASFAAGWKNQIEPCAAIAPMLVTEMDWMPSKYNASWGKSITGKMLGQGFGANFKLLADRTGNVGWMLFTGPELLAKFRRVGGSEGNYTMFNDPEACMWPAYHWFEEYAGEPAATAVSTELYISPRVDAPASGMITMQTGSTAGAAIIADRGIGVDFNLQSEMSVDMSTPGIVEWDGGGFNAIGQGTTDCKVYCEVDGQKIVRDFSIRSTPFPLLSGYFNPSIWESGTFDEQSGTVITGQYGFAGWKFPNGLDLSAYNYLIADVEGASGTGLSFRVFDIDNYWTDPAIADFGGNLRVVIDLRQMTSTQGRNLDPSHIYIVGFWSYGGRPFRIREVFCAQSPDAASVESETALHEVVDVVDMQGRILKRKAEPSRAAEGLAPGLYIIGGKKTLVK